MSNLSTLYGFVKLNLYLSSENALLVAVLDSCQLMKGDGQCDDLCNNPEMNFDGGDCCSGSIDSTYCLDCFCYQDCSYHNQTQEDHWYNTITDGYEPALGTSIMDCYAIHSNLNQTVNEESCFGFIIGDGICDDDCNDPEHQFDGGDCCLSYSIDKYCEECFCYEDCAANHWTLDIGF